MNTMAPMMTSSVVPKPNMALSFLKAISKMFLKPVTFLETEAQSQKYPLLGFLSRSYVRDSCASWFSGNLAPIPDFKDGL
jgi:hypothetical protein